MILDPYPDKEHETIFQTDIVCPHCGHIHENAEFDDVKPWELDNIEWCHECGYAFNLEVHIDVCYSTKINPNPLK